MNYFPAAKGESGFLKMRRGVTIFIFIKIMIVFLYLFSLAAVIGLKVKSRRVIQLRTIRIFSRVSLF